jgi:K+-sensing histidine kinase KdpD
MAALELLDLTPVIVAAAQWGIWPATVASVVGTGAADLFFLPHSTASRSTIRNAVICWADP